MEQTEQMEQQDLPALQVLMAQTGLTVQPARLALQAITERMEPMALPAQLVLPEITERQALLVLQVPRGLMVSTALTVQPARLVPQGQPVQEEQRSTRISIILPRNL